MTADDAQVAVIGGGVVGCAVAHALARRGVSSLVLEAEPGLALAASGTNSGILHTGFDSEPGALETRLILRSAALREQLLEELAAPVWRCGARLTPRDDEQRQAVDRLAENARVNDVEVVLESDGSLADATLLQIQADAVGVDLTVGPPDTTVLGAALLAGVGAGLFASVGDAAEHLPRGRVVAPRAEASERSPQRERWRAFVQAAASL